jgi:hypothetical protein
MKTISKDLVAGYLKHFETRSDDDLWAFMKVADLCRGDAIDAIGITVALVEACESDAQLAYVAAGPLEDILCGNASVYSLVDKECKISRKFLRAVHLTYMDETDESFARWKVLLQENRLEIQNDT